MISTNSPLASMLYTLISLLFIHVLSHLHAEHEMRYVRHISAFILASALAVKAFLQPQLQAGYPRYVGGYYGYNLVGGAGTYIPPYYLPDRAYAYDYAPTADPIYIPPPSLPSYSGYSPYALHRDGRAARTLQYQSSPYQSSGYSYQQPYAPAYATPPPQVYATPPSYSGGLGTYGSAKLPAFSAYPMTSNGGGLSFGVEWGDAIFSQYGLDGYGNGNSYNNYNNYNNGGDHAYQSLPGPSKSTGPVLNYYSAPTYDYPTYTAPSYSAPAYSDSGTQKPVQQQVVQQQQQQQSLQGIGRSLSPFALPQTQPNGHSSANTGGGNGGRDKNASPHNAGMTIPTPVVESPLDLLLAELATYPVAVASLVTDGILLAPEAGEHRTVITMGSGDFDERTHAHAPIPALADAAAKPDATPVAAPAVLAATPTTTVKLAAPQPLKIDAGLAALAASGTVPLENTTQDRAATSTLVSALLTLIGRPIDVIPAVATNPASVATERSFETLATPVEVLPLLPGAHGDLTTPPPLTPALAPAAVPVSPVTGLAAALASSPTASPVAPPTLPAPTPQPAAVPTLMAPPTPSVAPVAAPQVAPAANVVAPNAVPVTPPTLHAAPVAAPQAAPVTAPEAVVTSTSQAVPGPVATPVVPPPVLAQATTATTPTVVPATVSPTPHVAVPAPPPV